MEVFEDPRRAVSRRPGLRILRRLTDGVETPMNDHFEALRSGLKQLNDGLATLEEDFKKLGDALRRLYNALPESEGPNGDPHNHSED